MGWSFGYSSLSDVRSAINADHGPAKIVKQASTCYDRHLWTVYEKEEGLRWVHLDLIEKRGSDWGYKSMDEAAHPFYYDCPLSLIEAAGPTEHPGALEWRAKVHALHTEANREYRSGDVVSVHGKYYRVLEKVKRSYLVQSGETGRTYKVSPAKMTLVGTSWPVLEVPCGI